jgi:hypothetical protein
VIHANDTCTSDADCTFFGAQCLKGAPVVDCNGDIPVNTSAPQSDLVAANQAFETCMMKAYPQDTFVCTTCAGGFNVPMCQSGKCNRDPNP